MCPKCGVKMSHVADEDEVDILLCPICKDGYMTISGELLKEISRISKVRGEDIDVLLLDALKDMKNR